MNRSKTCILFVCHGNICRSPMAEFVMKKTVSDAGAADRFRIESAATSSEEIGSRVHYKTAAVLERMGIDCSGKRARRIKLSDYDDFDYIIGMDSYNKRNLLRFFGGDPGKKIYNLMDFTGEARDVDDPWYTGDFEATRRDVVSGTEALFKYLTEQK